MGSNPSNRVPLSSERMSGNQVQKMQEKRSPPFHLEAQFWGQKGGSKAENGSFLRPFLCNISWLAWSDPKWKFGYPGEEDPSGI